MANLAAFLVARLEAVAGVTNLASTRIYPKRLPQAPTLEAITFDLISQRRDSAMGADVTQEASRVSVSSWGNTWTESQALDEEVKTALRRYSGSTGGVTVHDVFIESTLDLDEEASGQFRHVTDFLIWHER